MTIALKIAAFAALSTLVAGLALFRRALRTGDDPSDDGPRAMISEFSGFWAGAFLLGWSFTVEARLAVWTLRIAAVVAVVVGLILSTYFAATTEVPETANRKPTGFKNDSTDLHLE